MSVGKSSLRCSASKVSVEGPASVLKSGPAARSDWSRSRVRTSEIWEKGEAPTARARWKAFQSPKGFLSRSEAAPNSENVVGPEIVAEDVTSLRNPPHISSADPRQPPGNSASRPAL